MWLGGCDRWQPFRLPVGHPPICMGLPLPTNSRPPDRYQDIPSPPASGWRPIRLLSAVLFTALMTGGSALIASTRRRLVREYPDRNRAPSTRPPRPTRTDFSYLPRRASAARRCPYYGIGPARAGSSMAASRSLAPVRVRTLRICGRGPMMRNPDPAAASFGCVSPSPGRQRRPSLRCRPREGAVWEFSCPNHCGRRLLVTNSPARSSSPASARPAR